MDKWDLLIAHPPCTYLSNAGAVRLYRKIDGKSYVDVDRLNKGLDAKEFFMRFLTAPNGRGIAEWVKKGFESVQDGTASVCVMLLPARTDTRWFHEYIYKKAEIRFVKGRLKFGNSKNSAPFPSMVVIFERKES